MKPSLKFAASFVLFSVLSSASVFASAHPDHVIYMDAGAACHIVVTGASVVAPASGSALVGSENPSERELKVRLEALGIMVD